MRYLFDNIPFILIKKEKIEKYGALAIEIKLI